MHATARAISAFSMVVLSVAAALAFVLTPTGQTYAVQDVLTGARAAIGHDPDRDAESGVILTGEGLIENMPIQISLSYDGAGRYAMDGRGKISMASGHDGEVTWEQSPTGRVRRLQPGEQTRALLPYWIISGYWTRPSAPLDLYPNRRESNRKRAAVDVYMKGTEFGGTMVLDTTTWRPVTFTLEMMGREMTMQFERYRQLDGQWIPEELRLTDNGRTTTVVRFRELTAVSEFPPETFLRPEDASRVSWVEDAPAELEVRRGSQGHLFVRPTVDDEEVGWFAFDTGARSTTLDRSIARKLDLPVIGEVRATGVGGQTREQMHSVRSIRVGPVRLESIPVAAGDMKRLGLGIAGGPDGLLGMDLLAHAVIVYDLGRSRIWLHDPATYDLPFGEWMPLLDYNGKPTVRMKYEDFTGIFTIDTGNPGAILFSPFAVARHDLLKNRDASSIRVSGIGGDVAARTGRLDWVEWGGQRFADVRADFVTEERGVTADRFRDGVIGAELLDKFVVVFDMPGGRIAYLPRGGESASVTVPLALALAVSLPACATAKQGESMDQIATSYVKLVLAVGPHDAGYVDAYYGPEAWQDEAKSRALPLDEIRNESAALVAKLEKLDMPADEMVRLRQRYLIVQLRALIAYVGHLEGKTMPFDVEAEAFYDTRPSSFPATHFDEILEKLEQLLPGDRPLAQRYALFREDFVIPAERVDAVFRKAIEACRIRTAAHLKLPEGESFRLEYVGDKSWSGYNWYQGKYHSLIQVNTDLPISIDRAVDLACHEGYPGHHVYNVLLEKHLVRDRGWVEYQVYPLFSPQSLIAEGTANFGIEVAFPGGERIAFEREHLFPLAGIDPEQASRFYRIQELVDRLGFYGNEVARMLLDGKIDDDVAAALLHERMLMTPDRAERRVQFVRQYRSYVINYNHGLDLVRAWVVSQGGTAEAPDRRWEIFSDLLSSPRLPSDLQRRRVSDSGREGPR